MPAHMSLDACTKVKLADGSSVSPLSWRANRLVDAVAKRASLRDRASLRIVKFLEASNPFVRNKGRILAQATYRANHCSMTVLDADGNHTVRVVRDATAKPRSASRLRTQRLLLVSPLQRLLDVGRALLETSWVRLR